MVRVCADEVIVDAIEAHLRSTKGLPQRESSFNAAGSAHDGGSLHSGAASASGGHYYQVGSLQRRNSYKDHLESLAHDGSGGETLAATASGLPSMAASGTRRCRLFIELDQCLNGEWSETHHWNWALQQEASTGSGGGWSQPRLPTISARALVRLHEGLDERNVILDVPGGTLAEVASAIVDAFIRTGLDPSLRQQVLRIISSRLKARPFAGAVASPRPGLLDLSPAEDEEAFEMLLVHTDLVTKPVFAFLHLATPIQVGCEKATPVRFLFALIAPVDERERSVRLASAFAAIMLDEDFLATIHCCTASDHFRTLLGDMLSNMTIVPHSRYRAAGLPPPAAGGADDDAAAGAPASAAVGPSPRASPSLVRRAFDGMRSRSAAGGSRRGSRTDSPTLDLQVAAQLAPGLGRGGVEPADSAQSASSGLESRAELELEMAEAMATNAFMSVNGAHDTAAARSDLDAEPTDAAARRHHGPPRSILARVRSGVHLTQKLSLPLVCGIVVALIWANVDFPSYSFFVGSDQLLLPRHHHHPS